MKTTSFAHRIEAEAETDLRDVEAAIEHAASRVRDAIAGGAHRVTLHIDGEIEHRDPAAAKLEAPAAPAETPSTEA